MYRDDLTQKREALRLRIESLHERSRTIEKGRPEKATCLPVPTRPPALLDRDVSHFDARGLEKATHMAGRWSEQIARAERFQQLLWEQSVSAKVRHDFRVLHPAPRPVPFRYVLAEMAPIWILAILAAASFLQVTLPVGNEFPRFLVALAATAIVGLAIRHGRQRRRFLTTCEQALAVTNEGPVKDPAWNQGSSRYTNWPVRRSKNWTVTAPPYTGSGTHDQVVANTLSGTSVRLVVGGVGYTGGVVLHSPDGTEAHDVKDMICEPLPTKDGAAWERALPWTAYVRIVLLLAAVACALDTVVCFVF